MTTWCVGGRAAPPRGGGSLAVCLLRPQVRRRRGAQSCSPWHRLLLGARGELLSKTFHTLCYFTLCVAKRGPTKTHIFFMTCLLSCPPHPTTTHRDHNTNHNKDMDVNIKGFDRNEHVVEVGADDTVEGLRQKVASAVGLPEDGFCMSFGGEAMDEGYDMTQLSAGDTVVLTKVKKYEARAALHALGETDITAERLKTVEDPEVACLLLQAEVATVIPDWFLLKSSMTSLDLSAESVVTQIGHFFLYECTSLTSIDLSGLIHVTQIGIGFLSGCSSLCNLDLTPLSHVTKIEASFLSGCRSLCTLHLSPFSSVTEIGFSFLDGCTALRTLDLSPLRSVTQLHHNFMICTSLESIYLTGCSDVVSSRVREEELWHLVVESHPKPSRDEPLEESRKRLRHAE